MSTINEKVLLYRIQTRRDPEAYGELYDRYVRQIYRFVYFKVSSREEAEDITADVFLKVWNYLQEHADIKSFSGLLYRIARNAVVDVYRTRTTQNLSHEDVREMDIADQGIWQEKIELSLEHGKILQALKKLKEEYREVITLRFIDGLDMGEIAAIMNKGQVTVRVTLHRAIKKLHDILEW